MQQLNALLQLTQRARSRAGTGTRSLVLDLTLKSLCSASFKKWCADPGA